MTEKTVLITGCSSGIGKLSAQKFQKEGWRVVATMRTPEKEQELNRLDNVWVTDLDVVNMGSVKSAVGEAVARFGGIDVLVNNAAYGGHGLFEQWDDESIRAMFETNFFGLMNVTREVLPHMRRQMGGSIINVSSIVGILATPNRTIYSSTKFAVTGFSEALALELKPLDIRVKTVAPGAFATNFSASSVSKADRGDDELKDLSQRFVDQIAVARKNAVQSQGPKPVLQDVADLIYKCATEETPVHNVVGSDVESMMQMKDTMSHHDFLTRMEGILVPT